MIGDPKGARTPTSWFNLDAFALPAPGTIGNAKRGIIEGPGNWIVNLGLYKNVVRADGYRVEFRATFENMFNHPQFVVEPESAFLDITAFLIDGLRENGVTNVLASPEQLQAQRRQRRRSATRARIVRLGRARRRSGAGGGGERAARRSCG